MLLKLQNMFISKALAKVEWTKIWSLYLLIISSLSFVQDLRFQYNPFPQTAARAVITIHLGQVPDLSTITQASHPQAVLNQNLVGLRLRLGLKRRL
jgi:hypothetical protein